MFAAELRSTVILSVCESTSIEVSSTLLRADINCLSDTYAQDKTEMMQG